MRSLLLVGTGTSMLVLSGCGALPNSGPTETQILKTQKDAKKNTLGFGIVQISADLVSLLESESPSPLSALNSITAPSSSNDAIGPGDTLQISIYEVGNSLFGGTGGNASGSSTIESLTGSAVGSPPAAGILMGSTPAEARGEAGTVLSNLPPLVVSANGTITVPYIGTMNVSHQTTDSVAANIRGKLTGKSQSPQVIVRLIQGVTNSALIFGDVKRPGRVSLSPSRERLLDIVALAQGTVHAPEDSVIQIIRGEHVVRVPMTLPVNDPSENIQIRPGDRINVMYKPRAFTVFGAAGKVSEVPFNVPELTLAEALARAGGPSDGRADPNGVFLLRYENNDVVRRLGLPVSDTATVTPVVYQIDMMNAGNYFLAQRFVMRDKDLLYFSNSKSNEFYKLFALISTIVQPGITAGYMAR
ncbi:capsule polysaccharide export protein [Asaia lannensis NBRC 102526]|nr:capsule polysaccharide export protein [Asaia lannensis NBRC 102526]